MKKYLIYGKQHTFFSEMIAQTSLISETFWPDFRESDLLNSITDYQNRQRRFGQTAEQVKL